MKQMRRRRHLRPRCSRSQINHRLRQLQSARNLIRLEWLLEAARPEPCGQRLGWLHDRIVQINDDLQYLESC
jgi:hypothetical protein